MVNLKLQIIYNRPSGDYRTLNLPLITNAKYNVQQPLKRNKQVAGSTLLALRFAIYTNVPADILYGN